MTSYGFQQSQIDHTLFYKYSKDGKVEILIVYVDEIILTDDDIDELERLKKRLAKDFEIKDLGLLGCKVAETPIEPNLKLHTAKPKDVKNIEQYQRLVGRLIYLSPTRLDIAFAVSMVLANRLKKVVGKVILEAQIAFVEGRQILDASLIANEAIDSILKNNYCGILCKLDIEKTYDHVNWTFLLSVLHKMGFGEKWIRWMKRCIVLFNDTSVGFFQSFRGLRQGNPLSPYLFVVAMEALNCLIKRVVNKGLLKGCQVRGKGGEGAISGLKINLEKSELIPVGEVNDIEELALEMGCKEGGLPSSYLGL
ncbi:hypothetical protein CK203_025476 [Vitis vinifera]|uniref:Reverse transcriptase domain-containing protein n=1 Tax=Vitis vinifera TaxID=29760 RepID=A0A438IZT2_VITVI|nr:hypothetical protein CK203_025476 [Vitis vinifera]